MSDGVNPFNVDVGIHLKADGFEAIKKEADALVRSLQAGAPVTASGEAAGAHEVSAALGDALRSFITALDRFDTAGKVYGNDLMRRVADATRESRTGPVAPGSDIQGPHNIRVDYGDQLQRARAEWQAAEIALHRAPPGAAPPTSGGAAKITEEETDPLRALLESIRNRTKLNRRIANDEENALTVIKEEAVQKARRAAAEQRVQAASTTLATAIADEAAARGRKASMLARQFDPKTDEGVSRIQDVAQGRVDTKEQQLNIRQEEIARTDPFLHGQNQAMEAALSNEIEIVSLRIQLGKTSVANAAERKVLEARLNSLITLEAQERTTAVDLERQAKIQLGSQRQGREIKRQVLGGETDEDRIREAGNQLAERQRELQIRGYKREGVDVGAEGKDKAESSAQQRAINIEAQRIELLTGAATEIAKERVGREQMARAVNQEARLQTDINEVAQEQLQARRAASATRRSFLSQETPTDRGNEAELKADERARELELRRLGRGHLDVGAEANDSARTAGAQRSISIEQLKIESEAVVVAQIAEEKVLQERKNRLVNEQVRISTNINEVAAEVLAQRRQEIAKRRAVLAQETPADHSEAAVANVEGRLSSAQRKLAEQLELRTAAGQEVLATEAQLARSEAQQSALTAQQRATDTELNLAKGQEARAHQEGAARQYLATRGGDKGLQGEELLAKAAVVKRAEADRQKALIAQQTGAEEIKAAAERKVSEERVVQAQRAYEAALRGESAGPGSGGPASRFQRLQARLSANDKPADEYQTAGQFIGQKALTTVGYGISGLVAGGLTSGLIDAVKNASALEVEFAKLGDQMTVLGQGNQLEPVRIQIRDIANETGQSAVQVTQFYSRVLGVFGDTERAARETESAFKLMTISGTDFNALMSDLVPTSREFNVSFEQIGDMAVTLHDKFGIAEQSTLKFLGNVSAAAVDAGLSFQETSILGGVMANSLGKDIGAAGDNLARILPQLQQNMFKIMQVYQSNPNTAQLAIPVLQAAATGNTGQALIEMLRTTDQLTEAQKVNLIQVSGSRRDYQALSALFSNSAQAIRELGGATNGMSVETGGLERRFREVADTAQKSFEQLKETIKSLVVEIANAGVLDAFKDVATAARDLLGIFGLLGNAMGWVRDLPLIGAAVKPLEEMAVFAAIASAAYIKLGAVQAARGAQSITLTNAEGEAITLTTAAKVKDIAVTTTSTEAEGLNAASRGGVAAAAGAERAAIRFGVQDFPGSPALANAPTLGRIGSSRLGQRILSDPSTGLGRLLAGGAAKSEAIDLAAAEAGTATGVGIIPGVGIAAAGAIAVHGVWDDEKNKANDQVAHLRDLFAKADRDKLRKISEQHGDFWDSVASTVLRHPQVEDVALQELGKGAASDVEALDAKNALAGLGAVVSKEDRKALEDRINQRTDLSSLKDLPGITLKTPPAGSRTGPGYGYTTGTTPGAPGELPRPDVAPGGTDTPRVELTDEFFKPENLTKLAAEAKKNGNLALSALLDDLINKVRNGKNYIDINKVLNASDEEQDLFHKVNDAGGASAYFGDYKRQVDAGSLTEGQSILKMNADLEVLRRATRGKNGEQLPEVQKQYLDGLKTQNDMIAGVQNSRVDMVKRLAEITSTTPKTETLTAALQALPYEGLDQQLQQLPQLMSDVYTAWQERIDRIPDPTAREAAEREGVKIPEYLQGLRNFKDIKQTPLRSSFLAPLAGDFGFDGPKAAEDFEHSIATDAVAGGKPVLDSVLGKLRERSLTEQSKFMALLLTDKSPDADKHLAESAAEIKKLQTATLNAYDTFGTNESGRTLVGLSGFFNKTGDDMKLFVAEVASKTGKSVKEVVDGLIDDALAVQQKIIDDPSKVGTQDYEDAKKRIDLLKEYRANTATQFPKGVDDVLHPHTEHKDADFRIATQKALNDVERAKAFDNRAVIAQKNLDDAIKARDEYKILRTTIVDGHPLVTDADVAAKEAAVVSAQNAQVQDAQARYLTGLNDAVVDAGDDPQKRIEAQLIIARQKRKDAERNSTNPDDWKAADQEIRRLNQDSLKAQQEVDKAQFDLASFADNRDPVKAAQRAVQRAEQDILDAKARLAGTAELKRLDLALAVAKRAQEDALSHASSIHSQMTQAILNAAGDTVGAAEEAAKDAQRLLADAQSKGITGELIDQLTADVVTKNRAALDASVANQEDIISFLLTMGKITTGQAIERLKVEAAKYDSSTKEWRDIQLRIHSLEQSAGQDAQYNLPANIALPTLYEARRLNQSNMMGIGYQDNRVVNLQISVNGTSNPNAVAKEIVSVFQAASGRANQVSAGVGGIG